MERYIVLLRGVNISGKNKVEMPRLKEGMIALGFQDVRTYLNSGNLIFTAVQDDVALIEKSIQKKIEELFELSIPVFIIKQSEVCEILTRAPNWWGTEDRTMYDNLIFVLPPATVEVISGLVGEVTDGIEKVQGDHCCLFWSFDRKCYAKANWWQKTASSGIGEKLTIRSANTIRKVSEM